MIYGPSPQSPQFQGWRLSPCELVTVEGDEVTQVMIDAARSSEQCSFAGGCIFRQISRAGTSFRKFGRAYVLLDPHRDRGSDGASATGRSSNVGERAGDVARRSSYSLPLLRLVPNCMCPGRVQPAIVSTPTIDHANEVPEDCSRALQVYAGSKIIESVKLAPPPL